MSPGETHPPRRTLVVANPTAGTFRRSRLDAIVAALRQGGAPVDVRLTQRAGEIAEICATIPGDVGLVVVAGGDGSVNEAIAGFEQVAEPPPLALIPFGTANVLAHELGLPRRPAALAEVILGARTAPLHYGRVNGRPFVLMVSAGFDATVVHSVSLAEKRRLGKAAYFWTALRLTFGRRPGDITVEIGDERITCRLAAVLNVSRYGGPFRVSPNQSPHLPGLHLVIAPRDDVPAVLRLGAALMFNRLARSRDLVIRPITRCRLDAATPVPCQVDGDTFGTLPVEITAADRALRIVVP